MTNKPTTGSQKEHGTGVKYEHEKGGQQQEKDEKNRDKGKPDSNKGQPSHSNPAHQPNR